MAAATVAHTQKAEVGINSTPAAQPVMHTATDDQCTHVTVYLRPFHPLVDGGPQPSCVVADSNGIGPFVMFYDGKLQDHGIVRSLVLFPSWVHAAAWLPSRWRPAAVSDDVSKCLRHDVRRLTHLQCVHSAGMPGVALAFAADGYSGIDVNTAGANTFSDQLAAFLPPRDALYRMRASEFVLVRHAGPDARPPPDAKATCTVNVDVADGRVVCVHGPEWLHSLTGRTLKFIASRAVDAL